MRKAIGGLLTLGLTAGLVVTAGTATAYADEATPDATATSSSYTLYPQPQSIVYGDGDYILRDINVIYDDAIDEATRDRLEETAALKDLDVAESDEPVAGKTNVYVGVHDSGGDAEQAIEAAYDPDDEQFDRTDAYFLKSDNGTISVLGADTDASFYGLTTLYQVFGQLDSLTIRDFTVTDHADVVSRGFIEGYYGNPWSTQDRIDLMTWGGYYKLNSYFYAPKDDPKHNAQWRTLYTDEEIETKIKPLAEAGNASKTRFVFALHPYMYNALRYDTDEHYEADLKVMQAKFTQVIEAGVRQIAILADDAANVGAANYNRTLTDMVAWLKEMKKTYPDLKTTLPFCAQEYMGNGQAYFANFPKEVQVVMTGGRIWGEVSDTFTNTFTNTAGRGPYMWINWPCSDNSKNHLIMGGYSTFLHPGTDPAKIQGIVLNPMQQSQPSKVAIFGNAAYSWNIWDTAEQADQTWNDAFSFVDHNSAVATPASDALRELSKHMINQNMDSRVTALQESVDLAPVLDEAREAINAGTLDETMIDRLAAEFTTLRDAAATYREQGDATMLGDIGKDYSTQDANEQLAPWIDAWDDTTEAALAYLDAFRALASGDDATLMSRYSAGQQAYARSRTHGLYYVDHQEYAEVGVQHIVPFIKAMDAALSRKVQELADPNVVTATYISDVFTNPSTGSLDDILDGDDATTAVFQNPNFLYEGNYVGVSYNRPITLESVRFAFDGGKNHFYHAKVQTSADGETWTDVPDATFERPRGSEEPIEVTGLNIANVTAVRLIATADNGNDLWLGVRGIDVNKPADTSEEPYTATGVTLQNLVATYGSTTAMIIDGDPSTIAYLKDPSGDRIAAGASFTVDLGAAKPIGEITLTGHASAQGDRPSQGVIEVSADGENWTEFGRLADAVTTTVTGNEKARYVRVRNTADKAVWWRVGDISIVPPAVSDPLAAVYTSLDRHPFTAELSDETAALSAGEATLDPNDYIGLDLASIRRIAGARIDAGDMDGLTLQYSDNAIVWTDADDADDLAGHTARYVRLIAASGKAATAGIVEFALDFDAVGGFGTLVSSDIEVQASWGDARDNGAGFDGDMSTVTKFGGNPYAGDSVVYDLGQPIDVTSLRIYTQDSQLDYIRDVKVQMSADGTEWTDAFEIGDGVTDTDRTTAFGDIADDAKRTDSNHPNVFYYGKDDIAGGEGVRYLRLLVTADYPQRALAFNELMVNQGAYVSVESNAAFESSVVEERGHAPSLMLDGDLTTTWRPSAGNGTLTLRMSADTGIRSFRLVHAGKASGAAVTGTVYDTATDKVRDVEFGTLDQAINAFKVPDGTTLLTLGIVWGDQIPEIAQLVTLTTASSDRTIADAHDALDVLVGITPDGYASWTTSSRTAYDEALAVARKVNAGAWVETVSLDSARKALSAAATNAKAKASDDTVDALRALADEALSNDDHHYTAVSYAPYASAVAAVRTALDARDDLTKDAAATLTATVEKTRKALVFSSYRSELARLAVEQFDAIDPDAYTDASYETLAAAKQAIDELLSGDGKPAEFQSATADYTTARDALVNAADLKALIAEAAGLEEADYTADSWKPFAKALEDARKAAESGSAADVANARAALAKAQADLERVTPGPGPDQPDTTLLDKTIADMRAIANEDADGSQRYTVASYAALVAAVDKAEADKAAQDAALNDANLQAMKDARAALVPVADLLAKVAEARAIKADDYTTASHAALARLIADDDDETTDPTTVGVATLLDHGTADELAARVAAIGEAIGTLTPAANGMAEYVAAIVEIDNADGRYTADSYAAYKTALDALRALAAQGDRAVARADYETAKSAYETAVSALAHTEADYTEVDRLLGLVPGDLSGYTDESAAALRKVIDGIERGKTAAEQDVVDGYAAALDAAIKALQPKTPSEGTGDDKPGQDGQPGGTTGTKPGKPSKPGSGTANTGADAAAVAGLALAAALLGAGVTALRRRRA